MIAHAYFASIPNVCLANGDYPLFSSKDIVKDYAIHEIEELKASRDLDQIRDVPYFEGYDTVNIVMLDETLYWVTSVSVSTNRNETLTFSLSYCAPSDQYLSGDTIKGVFLRTPSNLNPYLKLVINDDAMKNESKTRIPDILSIFKDAISSDYEKPLSWNTRCRVFWVEVTSTQNLQFSRTSDLIRYGFFTSYDMDDITPTSSKLDNEVTSYGGKHYPSLLSFLSNPDRFLPASSIQAIAISPVCPWNNIFKPTNEYSAYYTGLSISLVNYGNPSEPWIGSVTDGYIYQLDDGVDPDTSSFMHMDSNQWDTVQLDMDTMDRTLGTLSVNDASGNPISNIPTEYTLNLNTGDKLILESKCVSDYGSMTIHVRIVGNASQPMIDQVIRIPCGLLPFVGDAWEEYKWREQATDREASQYAIQNAQIEGMQSIAIAGTNAAFKLASSYLNPLQGLTGSGAVSAIGGVVTSTMQAGFNVQNVTRSANQTAKLTEHKLKASAGTGYQMGHGLNYVFDCCIIGMSYMLQMPANITESYFASYIENFGYPSEGYHEFSVVAGYYNGRIFPPSVGIKGERLADIANAGFRFIEIEGV